MADDDRSSLSGVSDAEAKEFHALFVSSFIAFTVIAAPCARPRLDVAPLDPWSEGLGSAGQRPRCITQSLIG